MHHMSHSYDLGLASKGLHRDMKNHVAPNKLVIVGRISAVLQNAERDLDILHLLVNGFRPEIIAVGLVQGRSVAVTDLASPP